MLRKFTAEQICRVIYKTEVELDIPAFITDPADIDRYVAAYLSASQTQIWEVKETGPGQILNIKLAKSETREAIEGGCEHKMLEAVHTPGFAPSYKCNGCGLIIHKA